MDRSNLKSPLQSDMVAEGIVFKNFRFQKVSDAHLIRARQAILEGRSGEAVEIYFGLTEGDELYWQRAGYYGLGVLYSLDGIAHDQDKAFHYFEKAADLGHSKATYFLAGILQSRGEIPEALQRFRQIAETDKSAAYWAYRILQGNSHLKVGTDDSAYYRMLAIKQGHLLAKRDEVYERIRGRQGLAKIPGGLIDFLRLIPVVFKAAGEEDKHSYG